jgi:hypothetical protein
MNTLPRTRFLTIVAQDPSVKDKNGNILKANVSIPTEIFALGPCGYRVNVIDYDTSTNSHYIPLDYEFEKLGLVDKFKDADDETIINDPNFHQQNVYAIVMRTLARFEFALGRRVDWGFEGHQLNVAPHAFADPNAFYSENDKALMFGYFRSFNNDLVFSCLSHDVVAHETTHAILDGLRTHYTQPSSPEQAGFHEGFSDVVALLSVFSQSEIIELLLDKMVAEAKAKDKNAETENSSPELIDSDYLKEDILKNSVLFGLAKEMGEALSEIRGNALRRSVTIKPLKNKETPYLEREEYNEPHRCGELLVASLMNAFLQIWIIRINELKKGLIERKFISRKLVVEQGSDAATHLLTMAIRAIDYTPPTDISFGDYLSALLTADTETVPDDTKYNYRKHLIEKFADYGIKPSSNKVDGSGTWQSEKEKGNKFEYDRVRFESLTRSRNEVFKFIWDNKQPLGLSKDFDDVYTRVQSVRPSVRISADGFILRETVAEYIQYMTIQAGELQQLKPAIIKPKDMPKNIEVTLYGGGTLIFDEFGQLKYHIRRRILSQKSQEARLQYLWKYGYFTHEDFTEDFFLRMHLRRSAIFSNHFVEEEF